MHFLIDLQILNSNVRMKEKKNKVLKTKVTIGESDLGLETRRRGGRRWLEQDLFYFIVRFLAHSYSCYFVTTVYKNIKNTIQVQTSCLLPWCRIELEGLAITGSHVVGDNPPILGSSGTPDR